MTDIVSISLDQIHVPEDYVRPLDEGAAQRLARLIEREGQKAPVAVYRSAARQGGEKPYTLIYGARRLRAMAIIGRGEVDAILRAKAEARRLQIMDNLAATSLDELEGAEYLAAYRELWEAEFGPVRRGGDRRSKGHSDTLIRDLQFLEKHNFFNHINEELGIKPRRAKRLLAISRIDGRLRSAIRGTQWAKDQKHLLKLTRFSAAEQVGICAAMKLEPDLEAVLRMADPATGREGVGRLETGDWQESHLVEHLDRMPKTLREAALERYGFIAKPLDPWPADLPKVRAVPAPDNRSPLWEMMRDPYRTLSAMPTIAEIRAAKAEQEEEGRMVAYLEHVAIATQINATEKERREKYETQVAKDKASRSRKPKRGRPADTAEVKLFKKLRKDGVSEDLADRLVNVLKADKTFWIVQEAPKLDAEQQREIAEMIQEEGDLDNAAYRVMKMLEDPDAPDVTIEELLADLDRRTIIPGLKVS